MLSHDCSCLVGSASAGQSPEQASRDKDDNSESDHVIDVVREQLREQLKECGIKLQRLSIEEMKICDEKVRKEMEGAAIMSASAFAQQSVLKQKAAVAAAEADVAAMARRVKEDSTNSIAVNAAKAELESAKLRAQAIELEARAKAKALEFEAEVLSAHPALVQLRIAEAQYKALGSSRVTIMSPDLKDSPYAFMEQGINGATMRFPVGQGFSAAGAGGAGADGTAPIIMNGLPKSTKNAIH